ncbi:MAG: hypothetical protein PHT47_00370 [Candidatus Cloacimonetes bacterium]|jgi:hypothetical protein|nr:hypothetical protein [Candidatus Cloacimonadota bacterium]MDD4099526.1 hypothetical protein [Candidatus Cloacimonadota bacterium]MDD4806470.1 hypothetical protein [Candidatus Cloacimonadota bacterium]
MTGVWEVYEPEEDKIPPLFTLLNRIRNVTPPGKPGAQYSLIVNGLSVMGYGLRVKGYGLSVMGYALNLLNLLDLLNLKSA